MTAYVSRTDDPDVPPPYDFPGITIMIFRLPASLTKLQSLCDECLNIGSLYDRGFEYRAFLNFVDMEIVTYPKMMFAQPPFSSWGYASQQELYFRFYVWKFVSVGGVLFPELIPELFFPFIYVDNSWSMISGRTVIGFPKVMMKFDPEQVLGANPLQIKASALALKTFNPNTKLEWQPIVEINPNTSALAPAAPSGSWPWIGLGGPIDDPLLDQLMQQAMTSIPDLFSTVQLKQCRETATNACYQAVINTPFVPSKINFLKPLPPVRITVHPYASLDIPKSLGFPQSTPLEPLLQYSVSLDMSMGPATTLFLNN